MKKLEAIVTLFQAPSDVEFDCPCYGANVFEGFEEFLDEQGLSWGDFSDWQYDPIKCPFCGNEIEVSYEFEWGGRMKTIALSDLELNLIHGLLADEEIRLKKAYKILSDHEDIFENTKKYIEEVNKLRKKFTEIDDTEDYFEVADRIEDYSLDNK